MDDDGSKVEEHAGQPGWMRREGVSSHEIVK